MANPRPTPKPENLRPPWPPGTSGNPAGYSRGRRISDAIERLIEEMALDREFGTTAIAMALGKKYMLKRKVKDPETGEEIWFEHKPDIARHLWGQTDLEFSPLRPRARSSAMRSRLAFDSLWSRAANRADRLGTLSGRERPRIGTSSARVASVWCFAR